MMRVGIGDRKITLRPAQAEDFKVITIRGIIDQIAKIAHEIWPDYGDFNEEFRWYLARGFHLNVAADGERVVGFILFRSFGNGGNIGWFAVKREYRGRGIGSTLLEAAEEKMLEDGVKFFFVDSDPASNWQFYARRGYEKVVDIYLPGEGKTQLFVKWVGERNPEELAKIVRPWLTTVYESIDDAVIRAVEEKILSKHAYS